jgi:hypothetical protein
MDSQVFRVSRASLDILGLPDFLALLDSRVTLVSLASLESRVRLVCQDFLAFQAKTVCLDCPDSRATLDYPVSQVLQVSVVRRDEWVSPAFVERRVTLVSLEPLVSQAWRDAQEPRASLAIQALLVFPVLLVSRETQASLVSPA